MTLFHHLQPIQLKHTICLNIKDLIKTKKFEGSKMESFTESHHESTMKLIKQNKFAQSLLIKKTLPVD